MRSLYDEANFKGSYNGLAPCPFCSSNLVTMRAAERVNKYWAHCDFCKAEGSPKTAHRDAAAAWNIRTCMGVKYSTKSLIQPKKETHNV